MGSKGWALILGGSKGLGLATVKKLAKTGYSIIVVHRDGRAEMRAIDTVFKKITSLGTQLLSFNADATRADKRTELVEKIAQELPEEQKIGVLVHSIAKGNLKPMVSETVNTLSNEDFMITTNAMAVSLYDWTKALVEANLFSNDTRIISFTSEGSSKVLPNYAAISAAKASLEAITRSIAIEFGPLGIKANCIQAGVTKTASFEKIPQSDKIAAAALNRNPGGRLTRPEDVANVVYLLCTKEAQWISGTVIAVDGGESQVP